MAGRKLFTLLLICTLSVSKVASDVFISPNGEDREFCGKSLQTACRSLHKGVHVAQENEKLFIHQIHKNKFEFCSDRILLLNKSLSLHGYDPDIRLGCQDKRQQYMMNISGIPDNIIDIKLVNLNVNNTIFIVDNANVTFYQTTIHDSKISSVPGSPCVSINLTESSWVGNVNAAVCNQSGTCLPTGEWEIRSVYLGIHLQNSTCLHTKFTLTAQRYTDFQIKDSTFSNNPDVESAHGGIYITVEGTSESFIDVQNTVFENQLHYDPIQSVMNLYEAALVIRTVKQDKSKKTNVKVFVSQCTFHSNERGLTLISDFNDILVTNCKFTSNIAMHAGAGILFLTEPFTKATVKECSFEHNAAGWFRKEKIESYRDSFQVSGDEVRIHSLCCKGLISFVGKGGAIRVQRGEITLRQCTFINNTARLLGGSIFVDREGKLMVIDNHYENSPDDYHSLQGDILYSNGEVSVKQARIFALTAKNNIAILRHSGNHWSIEVSDVSVQCPLGYRLRVTNTSAYGVTPIGLRRSYKLDQLSYFCESCDRNKYSLDYGYMNYSLDYSSFAYYTLLINGHTPHAAYNGTYTYHDIECLECPYGARCQQGITAVPNFWGYIHGNTLRFQHCPKNYCCTSTYCPNYDTCASYRTGTLCGSCVEGYSEAMFSPNCVPNENCDPTWLWPVAIASGTLYTLFLLFQKDIRDAIFTRDITCSDIPWHRIKQNRRSASRANHVSDDTEMNNPLHELFATDQGDSETTLGGGGTAPNETQLGNDSLYGFNDLNSHAGRPKDVGNISTQGKKEEGEKDAAPPSPPVDTGASFLIILFYYFQDAQLLQIKTVFASTESQSRHMLKTILTGLFKFRLEFFQFIDKMCFLTEISPSTKLAIRTLLVPYVLIQFGIMYIIYRCCTFGGPSKKLKTVSQEDKKDASQPPTQQKTFMTRMSTGFVLTLLFTYQKLASTSFTLLNCVPVGDEQVLFIEGTIDCYQVWQYGVMAYTASSIVPFCFILLLGPGLLKDGLIGLPQFFSACMFPFPFLLYWGCLRYHAKKRQSPQKAKEISTEAQSVMQILQGPFKDTENRLLGPTCGAGILIGRRLILVVLFTFVNDTLIRMLCMMLVCFIILLHHVHVLPYKDTRGNLAGSASAAALLVVGGINLVRAGFEAAEYVPQGPNALLMTVFEYLEDTLMLWFPVCVMAVVLLLLTTKIVMKLLKYLLTPANVLHTS